MPNAIQDAESLLENALIHFEDQPVGTVATCDPRVAAANYHDCFVRDFVPSALVFLLDGRTEIVRNFLHMVMRLKDQHEQLAGQHLAPGVLPASFKVTQETDGSEAVSADFGDRAIGRVAPVDSMMWWILLVRAYSRATGDRTLVELPECQRQIRQILNVCLQGRFEVFPTLLVPDGCFMIDRRMGVNGHPLEIQALFYAMLEASLELLVPDEGNQWLIELTRSRYAVLREYVQQFYWLDLARLNEIHRYSTEMFGHEIENPLNIYPESIPDWVVDWLPEGAGYLLGNLGPGRFDPRFFTQGNLLATMFGLASEPQSQQILHTFEQRWDDLIGRMPLKICYPALKDKEWRLVTGSDPKNTPWSYHNGGNWPVLLWPFVAACLQHGRRDLAERAYGVAEERLPRDGWPEYYDGRYGRLIGRRSNYDQVWSATALLLSRMMLDDPASLTRLGFGSLPQ